MDMESSDLVTVGVVTYNSAEFIIETLDSIFAQSYSNIELIVSDDCSTDNTIELVDNWITRHQSRFVSAYCVKTEVNLGVSGNCNNVLNHSKGKWEIIFAGDDVVLDDAIENYINYVRSHNNINFLFADRRIFYGNVAQSIEYHAELNKIFWGDKVSAKKQFDILIKSYQGSGITFFYNVELLKSIGGYDLRFPMIEDHPLYIRITYHGHKLYWMHKEVVLYRRHLSSISGSRAQDALLSNSEIRISQEYKFLYLGEHLSAIWNVFLKNRIWLIKQIISNGNSKSSVIAWFYFICLRVINPFSLYMYYLKLKNKLL